MTMTASRFRTERCAAHGLAIDLCESPICTGHQPERKRTVLIKRLEPPRCGQCGKTRGDAIKRGSFYGAKGNHPGFQSRWCDECWGRKEARDAEAASSSRTPRFRDRKAESAAHQQRQEATDD